MKIVEKIGISAKNSNCEEAEGYEERAEWDKEPANKNIRFFDEKADMIIILMGEEFKGP